MAENASYRTTSSPRALGREDRRTARGGLSALANFREHLPCKQAREQSTGAQPLDQPQLDLRLLPTVAEKRTFDVSQFVHLTTRPEDRPHKILSSAGRSKNMSSQPAIT